MNAYILGIAVKSMILTTSSMVALRDEVAGGKDGPAEINDQEQTEDLANPSILDPNGVAA